MTEATEEQPVDEQPEVVPLVPDETGHPFFRFMAKYPLPYLIVLPVIFCVVLVAGWTKEDIIEDEVANIWIAEGDEYAKDQRYAESLGQRGFPNSNFAALAISRDDKNIMTASRLEEIRARMEYVESTWLMWNGVNYTWDDICQINPAPYQFPCLRLSPMDLFEEARWTFTPLDRAAWYQEIQANLVDPRLPRFGIMNQDCAGECLLVLAARATAPLDLFADLGNMEFNSRCRMCVESNFEKRITNFHQQIEPTFTVLSAELRRHAASLGNSATDRLKKADLTSKAGKLEKLATTITGNDVKDYYAYKTLRSLYIELGATTYKDNYALFDPLIETCNILGKTCPPLSSVLTVADAKEALARHVDGPFSTINAAGNPFPFWSDPVTGGSMFGSNSETTLYPVGGSGVVMSGVAFDMDTKYLDVAGYGTNAWAPAYGVNGFADPFSELWKTTVETDPIYSWFMAAETAADEGTMCMNEDLPGANTGVQEFDIQSAGAAATGTQSWCSPFDVPNPAAPIPGAYSKQHFARMWFDTLMSNLLNLKYGEDDPYSWTTGAGCGYSLGTGRYSYTGQRDADILRNASRFVYNIDEGTQQGATDRNLLLGGTTPPIGEYNFENPLTEVKVLQTIYAALTPEGLVQRVQHCQRPSGPINITVKEAEEVMKRWKEKWEGNWVKGWDDPDQGEVQFVGYFDDMGVIGTTGRMLSEITLDNSKLTYTAIGVIALFSAAYLYSPDLVESRVTLTLFGVGLVVLSFFAALGFGLLTGLKMNVSMAWTLPFVIIGLGVDDMYIMLLSMKKQTGYTEEHWIEAMSEVLIPVTMTSLINMSMFAILVISDVPAIKDTSNMACYCIIFLYSSVIFTFPAYCYYDFKRQNANRLDGAVCITSQIDPTTRVKKEDVRETMLYEGFYKKLVLAENDTVRLAVHAFVMVVSLSLVAIGLYGISVRTVGLGLEDFFPRNNPAYRWAQVRTEQLASWSVQIRWGELDYKNPETQMAMIKQFEEVVDTNYIAAIDTKYLWMADFLVWTSQHCGYNFDRRDFDSPACGYDQVFEPESATCSGSWMPNDFGLRLKEIRPLVSDTCTAFQGGVCRPAEEMFDDDLEKMGLTKELAEGESFCPVTTGWSDEKFKFCVERWRNISGSEASFVTEPNSATPTSCSGVYHNDGELQYPIPFSNGPNLFAFDLFTHDSTLDLLDQTRAICDDDPKYRCWMVGIPYDYWSQYEFVFPTLINLSGLAAFAGFFIALIFLFGSFVHTGQHELVNVVVASCLGSFLILVTIIFTLVSVTGLSILVGISLTGFSLMAFVLSVGFAVEYSVHIVSRWMRADNRITRSIDRVDYTMSFLTLPTFMAFISSTIGVVCLAFTEFEFSSVFFFRPLTIIMFNTYWFGCWFLPTLLIYIDSDLVKMGPSRSAVDVEDTKVSAELVPIAS